MAIDPDEVKRFWEARAAKDRQDAGVTNLEEDPALREMKIALEDARVAEYVGALAADARVLDLGGGNGHWAFKLAGRVAAVDVVDFCAALVDDGRRRAEAAGVANVRFHHAAAQDFVAAAGVRYDLIFVSGLLLYLNDDQLEVLLGRFAGHAAPGAVVVLRDGTGIAGRHEIRALWSDALGANYSAIYRTRDELVAALGRAGFDLERDDDMFAAGCALNKFPETRLRIYRFVRRSRAR